MLGVTGFLRAWDSPSGQARELPVRESAQGHRNLEGNATAPAVTFPRGHPQFAGALEDGVRDLVILLIERFDCVTYSSCEGHASPDGSTLLCGRSVDILPRDAAEYARLRDELRACIARAQRPSESVSLQLLEEPVETEVGPMPALALSFVPATPSPEQYFAALAPHYEGLLTEIARH